ncbi:MAG: ATP-binding protein, partial [Terriglobales bacterium]
RIRTGLYGRQSAEVDMHSTGVLYAGAFSDLLSRIKTFQIEKNLKEQRAQLGLKQSLHQGFISTSFGGIILSVLAALIYTIAMRKRIRHIQENTRRSSVREALLPKLSGRDELARLDSLVHEMATAVNGACERERALIDNAANIVCSVDRNGAFQWVNPFSRRMIGYWPNDLEGKQVLDFVLADDCVEAHTQLDSAIGNESGSAFEVRLVARDKSTVDTAWTMLWSDSDRSLFCVVRDNTEEKNVERVKEDFVAMVSHDLRTPLMSLSIDISLLIRMGEALPETAIEDLLTSEDTVKHLINLVNDLLDFAKLQAGKMQFASETVDVETVLAEVKAEIAELAASRAITFELSHTGAREVVADRQRLKQLLANLAGNGLRRSPPAATVSVVTAVKNGRLELSVRDAGAPDPTGNTEERFAPFTAGDTGFELAICKLIAERQGGSISVSNHSGGGATFQISLPVAGGNR